MKNEHLKFGLIIALGGTLVAGAVVFYMFNQPHRDVQAQQADYELQAKDIVNEYLTDADAANNKYLQEEGNSKIIAVSGTIASINEDLNNQKVVLLKADGEKAGVSCTFTASTNANAAKLKIGKMVTIKGVIRAGAGYDEDLDLYEDVIMEKSDVIIN